MSRNAQLQLRRPCCRSCCGSLDASSKRSSRYCGWPSNHWENGENPWDFLENSGAFEWEKSELYGKSPRNGRFTKEKTSIDGSSIAPMRDSYRGKRSVKMLGKADVNHPKHDGQRKRWEVVLIYQPSLDLSSPSKFLFVHHQKHINPESTCAYQLSRRTGYPFTCWPLFSDRDLSIFAEPALLWVVMIPRKI